ncbi:MAG: hypothetical protein PHE12_02445 [Clostridia bacterium]|nr:hypothetical protein [Clostridia bacterium]
MVGFFEFVIAFTIGLLLLYLICYFFNVKEKSLLYLTVNSFTGALVYFIISICINAQSVNAALFLCGFSGLAGCLLILLLKIF